jgi:hypothetical protein
MRLSAALDQLTRGLASPSSVYTNGRLDCAAFLQKKRKMQVFYRVRVVHLLSQKFFRDRLVEHFDIMYQRDKIQWPKRRGAKPAVFFDQ